MSKMLALVKLPEATAVTNSRHPLVAAPEMTRASGPVLMAAGRTRLAASLLRRKVNTLFRHFPLALTGDEEAIHQLRVSGRRLRVALPLLVVKPDGRRATRARRLLRLLTRTAGSSRDLDVLLETYDERLKALPARTDEQRLLRHRLASARRRSRARMVGNLLDLEISRLRGDLASLIARGGAPPFIVCERFAATSARESRQLYDEFTTLGDRLDARELHALRRRARRVRYAVEVFDQIRSFESTAGKPWKSLQDLIGVIHDHHVLAEWFDRQAQNDRTRGNVALATAASSEAAWARDTVRRLHAELLTAAPVAIVARGLASLGQASPAQPE
jgi:CHAD domain-containing protein